MILTTEVLVTDIPEVKAGNSSPDMGGMGGMGGMM
jgi:chaperonin GroEL